MKKEINENLLLTSPLYIKQKEYWGNKLRGEIDVTEILPAVKKKVKHPSKEGSLFIPVSDELSERLMNLSYGADLTIYIVLLAGLMALVHRRTARKDIIVISPVYEPDISRDTLNDLLFIRDKIDGTMSFKDLLIQVKQSVLEAYDNQDYPRKKLIEYLFDSTRVQDSNLISTVGCSLNNIHNDIDMNRLKIGLFFSFTREKDRLKGDILYDTGKFETYYVEGIANHLVTLLEHAVADVDRKISSLTFLPEQERRQLIIEFNNNAVEYPGNETVTHWIERHAEEEPDRQAVSFEGNEISYRQLNNRARGLAARLRELGVERDRLVGILLERSPLMMESILAVWKAGGAYIPMDVNDPVLRIVEIMEDSATRVLLTQSVDVDPEIEERYQGNIIKLHPEECGRPAHSYPEPGIDMNGLAYVIYTSGSTGKPKGVMVEHIGMMNHIQAKINDLELTTGSTAAQNASHTFDISVWQFFASLIAGGKTVIYPDQLLLEPQQFISRLIEDGVTILEVVPSYLSVMMEVGEGIDESFSLQYLLVTGEEVKPHLVKKWFEKHPHIKMVNAYGPTEASDDITHYIMNNAPEAERIPIGKPLQNLNIYIVDNNMKLCPVGVKGEICVSGIGICRGYLNDEKRTKEVFIKDPFAGDGQLRLYKTGDIGCWLPDGTIDFFGRKDYQVKIRGFRIEPGEIESKLLDHSHVKEVVVIDREDDSGDKYLCAYLVTVEGFNNRDIRDYLLEKLPDYMVPRYFVELEELPLTANGKIERKKLPEPVIAGETSMIYITAEKLKKEAVKPAAK